MYSFNTGGWPESIFAALPVLELPLSRFLASAAKTTSRTGLKISTLIVLALTGDQKAFSQPSHYWNFLYRGFYPQQPKLPVAQVYQKPVLPSAAQTKNSTGLKIYTCISLTQAGDQKVFAQPSQSWNFLYRGNLCYPVQPKLPAAQGWKFAHI